MERLSDFIKNKTFKGNQMQKMNILQGTTLQEAILYHLDKLQAKIDINIA